jgi:hypothetical protein
MQLVLTYVRIPDVHHFPNQEETVRCASSMVAILRNPARAPRDYYEELLVHWLKFSADAGIAREHAERVVEPLSTAYRRYELSDALVSWLERFSDSDGEWGAHYVSLWHVVPTRAEFHRVEIRAALDRRFFLPSNRSG